MKTELKNKLKYLALLDAVSSPEWEYRYYSYNSTWDKDEEMASLRDGGGGEWWILFFNDLVAFKCTSPVDGTVGDFEELKNRIPESFAGFLAEPAFCMDRGSCIWYLENESWIRVGNSIVDLPNPDTVLGMTAADYCQFAEQYYEITVDKEIVESIFGGGFKMEMAQMINPEIDINSLKVELTEIGIAS